MNHHRFEDARAGPARAGRHHAVLVAWQAVALAAIVGLAGCGGGGDGAEGGAGTATPSAPSLGKPATSLPAQATPPSAARVPEADLLATLAA